MCGNFHRIVTVSAHLFFRAHESVQSSWIVSTTDISRILFAGPATAGIGEPEVRIRITATAETGRLQESPQWEVIILVNKR